MIFYSDIAATLGIWDGSKMLTFEGGIYETNDPREIELLKSAGYRHDKEAEAKCQKNLKPQSQLEKTATSTSTEQTNTSQDASTPNDGAKPATQTKKKPSGRQQKK